MGLLQLSCGDVLSLSYVGKAAPCWIFALRLLDSPLENLIVALVQRRTTLIWLGCHW